MDDLDDVMAPEELPLEEYLEQLADWLAEEPPPSPPRRRIRDAAPEEELERVIIVGGVPPADER